MKRLVTAGAVLCALALAGCDGGNGGDGPNYGGDGQPVPSIGVTSPGDGGTSGPTGPGGPSALPPPGSCAFPPEAADGRYPVGDIGTVVARREGGTLVLGEVTTAAGWTHQVVREEPREIEIKFRSGEDEVEFEAEFEDAGVEVKVCRGD